MPPLPQQLEPAPPQSDMRCCICTEVIRGTPSQVRGSGNVGGCLAHFGCALVQGMHDDAAAPFPGEPGVAELPPVPDDDVW